MQKILGYTTLYWNVDLGLGEMYLNFRNVSSGTSKVNVYIVPVHAGTFWLFIMHDRHYIKSSVAHVVDFYVHERG